MRLYSFTNMYLSQIQRGIQTAHVVSELFNKYPTNQELSDWAKCNKTIIILNGGYSSNLSKIHELLQSPDNTFPFAPFHEEIESLNGALTAIGTIVPEAVYNAAAILRKCSLSPSELHLALWKHITSPSDTIINGMFHKEEVNYNLIVSLIEECTISLFLCEFITEMNKYGLA